MAVTTKTDVIIKEVFDDTIAGAFGNVNAFMGSQIVQSGALIVRDGMPESGAEVVGDTINIPYFGSIGEFDDIATDGDSLTPKKIAQTREQGTIAHSGIAINVTRRARSSVGKDIYQELAEQVVASATRKMDALVSAAAIAGNNQLIIDKYSSSGARRAMDYDLLVDAKMMWRDFQSDIAGAMVHSRVYSDLMKLKDADGRPLLIEPLPGTTGALAKLGNVPIVVSDRMPLDSSVMTAVSSTGTTPPVITLTGTPTMPIDLQVKCTTLGALATWLLKYSIDGGLTYSDIVASAATVEMFDPATGLTTGVTLNIAAGTAAVNNVWTAQSCLKHTSLLVKKGALIFWYNRNALVLQTQDQPLADSKVAALHLYAVAYRYKRLAGQPFPGVVKVRHNASVL